MLNNTFWKLTNEKKLTVAYFGGSITEAGMMDGGVNPSWRIAVGDWFVKTYPDCEIVNRCAAIGGTGSALGTFRCEKDLLSVKPDLVFIEYSVNDSGAAYRDVLANSETIVRKIREADPFTDLVYVHTITKDVSDRMAAGSEYTSRAAHSAVMHHYGIPQIDMGEILRTRIIAEGGDWLTYTSDTVHPRGNGHAVYADAVIAFLAEALKGAEGTAAPEAFALPEPLLTLDRMNAHLADASAVRLPEACAFRLVSQSLCGRYPQYIEAAKPGSSFTYRFHGRRIGLYLMMAKDSGDVVWSIDGGEEKTLRTWDTYCLRFNRAAGLYLGGEVEDGDHLLTVRVADTKAEKSEGTAIRIGAFMIY